MEGLVSGFVNGIKTFFIGDEEEGTTGVFGFLSSIVTGIGDIVSFITNFFSNLVDSFIHIFVPTTEQWTTIKTRFSDLGDVTISHLPFVSSFKTAMENAENNVSNSSDMLVISMPSFSFYGGQTQAKQYVNVREAYEPFRLQIRTGLTYIVYALGIVYIIKYILGWGQTQANLEVKTDLGRKE